MHLISFGRSRQTEVLAASDARRMMAELSARWLAEGLGTDSSLYPWRLLFIFTVIMDRIAVKMVGYIRYRCMQ